MPTSDEKCSTGNEIITFSDLATITRRIFGDTALKILHHSLSPFSEHKMGNTTTHRQLKITVQVGKKFQRPNNILGVDL